MNERIRALADEATTTEYGVDNGFDRVTFDKEKFARMIVRECANKVDSNLRDWLHDNSGTMGDKILEHFGVEDE
jgi:hypothetical protein